MFTYKDIPNHFSFSDVYDLVLSQTPDPATFVEVGCWLGASAAYMAGQIQASSKQIRFYAIDNFTAEGSRPVLRQQAVDLGGNFFDLFCENLRKCGVWEFVHPIVSDSTEGASHFTDKSVEFVYIDASHDYSKVKKDIHAWKGKVKPGGVLAGHDYDPAHPGVVRAVNEIFGSDNVKVMTHSWVYNVPAA